MPAERAPMRKVREVLRLRHALGLSEPQIAVSVGVSRSTVAEYLRRAGVVGITWALLERQNPQEVEEGARWQDCCVVAATTLATAAIGWILAARRRPARG
jgi:transposase